MAGIGTVAYNLIFKRSSTFTVAILVSTYLFERSFDLIADNLFDSINKGKQWKDIKHKYEE